MKLIVANLKMNQLYEDVLEYKSVIDKKYDNLVICPSYIYLDVLKCDKYHLGSQDGYYMDSGSYTGAVSFKQLKSIGVSYSIVGHSERRVKFNESDEEINKKIISICNNGMTAILCIGETELEKNDNLTYEKLKQNMDIALNGVNIDRVIIAYEPLWAIGSGVIPTIDEIENIHRFIKDYIKGKYNKEILVLYGGSVNYDNCKEISSIASVDGVLIGGASLDPNNLINIVEKIEM